MSAAPPAEDPLVGCVLADRFEIDALLARGGMGKVYRARQRPLDRVVALKTRVVGTGARVVGALRLTADRADDRWSWTPSVGAGSGGLLVEGTF